MHLVGSLVVQPDPVAEQPVEQGSELRGSEQTDKHRQDDLTSHSLYRNGTDVVADGDCCIDCTKVHFLNRASLLEAGWELPG